MNQPGNAIVDRLIGIVTFQPPTYREVAADTTATGSAAVIAIISAIIAGLGSAAFATNQSAAGRVIGGSTGLLATLLGWFIGAWLLAWVSKTFFQGQAGMWEMLRVTGFASVFNVLQIIPIIGSILAGILGLIAYIIGIREAARISTGQAVGTAIIAVIAVLVVVFVIVGLCLGAFVVALGISNAVQ